MPNFTLFCVKYDQYFLLKTILPQEQKFISLLILDKPSKPLNLWDKRLLDKLARNKMVNKVKTILISQNTTSGTDGGIIHLDFQLFSDNKIL
jgi:hypothetical protein